MNCSRQEGGAEELPRLGGLRNLVREFRLWFAHLVDGCGLDELRRNDGNWSDSTYWICECGRRFSRVLVRSLARPLRPLTPAALLEEEPSS